MKGLFLSFLKYCLYSKNVNSYAVTLNWPHQIYNGTTKRRWGPLHNPQDKEEKHTSSVFEKSCFWSI